MLICSPLSTLEYNRCFIESDEDSFAIIFLCVVLAWLLSFLRFKRFRITFLGKANEIGLTTPKHDLKILTLVLWNEFLCLSWLCQHTADVKSKYYMKTLWAQRLFFPFSFSSCWSVQSTLTPPPAHHLFSQGCHCRRQHLHLRPSSRWRPEEVKKQNLRGNEMEFGQETCSAGLDSKNLFLICLEFFLNPSITDCWNCCMSWLFVWLHHCTLNIKCTWHVVVVAAFF